MSSGGGEALKLAIRAIPVALSIWIHKRHDVEAGGLQALAAQSRRQSGQMLYWRQSRPAGCIVGDEGLGGSPVVQRVKTMGLPCHLGLDILSAPVRLA
jgi:hypothetical protein